MIKTVEELLTLLKKPGAQHLFIVGPYIGDYQLLTAEEAELFKLRGLARSTDVFYQTLTDKILTPCDTLKKLLERFSFCHPTYYAQTLNGRLQDDFEAPITYLKGNASHFECTGCHQKYTLSMLSGETPLRCECGRLIRPKCLLTQEHYDMTCIEAFEQEMLQADTLFLIGFDFNEMELCKQLEVISARKASGEIGPVVVVIGECDKEGVYETFYPEFIVDEKPENALARLLDKAQAGGLI